MKIPVMAHMIPWYPDRDRSLRVLDALIDAEVTSLELQFPFSDPTADGPSIAAACDVALAAGFTVDAGFDYLRETKARREGKDLYVMTYASLAVTRGVGRFVDECAEVGVHGLIVPDLPFDSDEGLYNSAKAVGISPVPVIVPNMDAHRLDRVLGLGASEIYCAIRSGITGTKSRIDEEVVAFVEKVRSSGARVLAGFGVQERAQAEELIPHVDEVIVGSALVRSIPSDGDPYQSVHAAARSIVGS